MSSYDVARNRQVTKINTQKSHIETGSIKFHLSLLPTTRNFDTVTKIP